MIGYMVEQEIRNALPGREVATLLTMAEVKADDPAFENPTKPIGPLYPTSEAARIGSARGWRLRPDGDGVRRVVPSPDPVRILEIDSLRALVRHGAVTICAGGGGIPVIDRGDGALAGAEVVIDKDLSAALLARALSADRLLMLTDVPVVYAGWAGRTHGRCA